MKVSKIVFYSFIPVFFILNIIFFNLAISYSENYKIGEYAFNESQWSNFKQEMFVNKIDYEDITYIDSNEPILVKFKVYDPDNKFSYGEYQELSIGISIALFILILLGTSALFMLVVGLPCMSKGNWGFLND